MDALEKPAMIRTQQARRDAKQLFRLCLTKGLLDEGLVSKVVQRVSETSNRNRFKVLSEFRRLVRLDCIRHTAKIDSAKPLPPGIEASVQAGLVRVYGPGLNISFTHSPALIGGMRIQVGSDVYDGTIQGRLAVLEANF